MPTYHNTASTAKNLPGHGSFAADEYRIVDEYVFPLPSDFELTAHGPAPWVTEHAAALPVSITSGLAQYKKILIFNNSGAACDVVVNGQTAAPFPVANSVYYPIEQDNEIDALSIAANDQAGNVYIIGFYKNVPLYISA